MDILLYIPKYFNTLSFESTDVNSSGLPQSSSGNQVLKSGGKDNTKQFFNDDDMKEVKEILIRNLKQRTKEKIYYDIILCKSLANNLKSIIDKVIRELPGLKNILKSTTIEYKITETRSSLTDSLIQVLDQDIYTKLKKCIFDEDWINTPEVATVSLSLKELTFSLYYFKIDIFDLLDDEKKTFGIKITNF